MPRGFCKDIDYRMKDLARYIEGLMDERHVTQAEAGSWIDIKQSRMSQKLKTCSFTAKELSTLLEKLNADPKRITRYMLGGNCESSNY